MRLILIPLILSILTYTASTQDWETLIEAEIIKDGTGYSTHDHSYGIYEDGAGNLYHTGYFEGEIKFGDSTLISKGSRDIFIAKINKNGGWDWAVSAGGESAEFSRDITCDNSGNIYITGYFYGSCTFGNQYITASGNSDLFIAKLSMNGQWLWARAGTGNGFNRGNSIVCDNLGYIYVAGSFESTISFGGMNLVSSGQRDICIVKLDTAGNWIKSVKAGGNGQEESLGIKYNHSEKFLITTGYYTANPSFGQHNLTGVSGRDIFVARMDRDLGWTWVESAASSGAEESKAVEIDGNGNSVITGYYTSAISFGDNSLPTAQGRDVFVAKISKNGQWLWASSAEGNSDDDANAIGTDNNGNIYITGSFFDEIKFGNSTLNSENDRNLFVAKLNSAGNWSWGRVATGSSSVDGLGISVQSNGISYISGSFYENVKFGNNSYISLGDSDFFIAKISSSGSWNWSQVNGAVTSILTVESISNYINDDIIISGNFYGTVKFGEDTLISEGSSDFYVARYSNVSGWVWAKSFGSVGFDETGSVCSDSSGNIYLSGTYSDTITIGNNTISTNGFTDAILIKLNSFGQAVWSISAGDIESDYGRIVHSTTDKIYWGGIYSKRPYFGNTRLTNKGYEDIFIAVLDSSGNYINVLNAGSNQFDALNSIDIDSVGSMIVTGGFEGTCYFGSNSVQSAGGDDIFIAKADSSGSWLWAVKAGTSNFQESGKSLCLDSDGNIYITGTYRALCLFGSQYLINNGASDIFLSKIDSDGNWIWSKGLGGSGADNSFDLKYDNGRIIMGAAAGSTFSYLGKQFLSYGSNSNSFIASFDTQGNLIHVNSDAGSGTSDIKSVCYGAENKIIGVGNFSDNISLGNLSSSAENPVDKNGFIAFLGMPDSKPDWTFADSTGKSAKIIIPADIAPKVNGRSFVIGDAVGVFYSRNNLLYCAGMSYWDGNDMEIIVWGDDAVTLVKDGFDDLENFNFKVWDVLALQEFPVKVRYEHGPEKFIDSGETLISQFPIIYDTLSINLKSGWNMVSSNITPINASLDDIFKNIMIDVSLVKNSIGKTYIPNFNINTIGSWSLNEGYQIYAVRNTTLKIIGDKVDFGSFEYNLSQGWSIISYMKDSASNPALAFAGLINQGKLILVKNIEGKSFIPQFNINTIGDLIPGQAYQIYLNSDTTFSYPE